MKNRDYKIFAIDFDGTLCEHNFPNIGQPNLCLINNLIDYKHKYPKTKYILWTCRRGIYLEEAKIFCEEHGLKIDYYNENIPEIIKEMGGDSRKIFADLYIDDKGYFCNRLRCIRVSTDCQHNWS